MHLLRFSQLFLGALFPPVEVVRIVQRARMMGFSLPEIRQLFFGFRGTVKASERWKKLSQKEAGGSGGAG